MIQTHNDVVELNESEIRRQVDAIALGGEAPLRKARRILGIGRVLGRHLLAFRKRRQPTAPETDPVEIVHLDLGELEALHMIAQIRETAGRALNNRPHDEPAAESQTSLELVGARRPR